MRQASRAYVSLEELLRRAGERIAELVGVEAAFITSGRPLPWRFPPRLHGGRGPREHRRLPDSAGMRNEILMLKAHRFGFDQAVRQAGRGS